jgi:hypothetical protein
MQKTTTVQVGDEGGLLDDMPRFCFARHIVAFDAGEDLVGHWPCAYLLDRVTAGVGSLFES